MRSTAIVGTAVGNGVGDGDGVVVGNGVSVGIVVGVDVGCSVGDGIVVGEVVAVGCVVAAMVVLVGKTAALVKANGRFPDCHTSKTAVNPIDTNTKKPTRNLLIPIPLRFRRHHLDCVLATATAPSCGLVARPLLRHQVVGALRADRR